MSGETWQERVKAQRAELESRETELQAELDDVRAALKAMGRGTRGRPVGSGNGKSTRRAPLNGWWSLLGPLLTSEPQSTSEICDRAGVEGRPSRLSASNFLRYTHTHYPNRLSYDTVDNPGRVPTRIARWWLPKAEAESDPEAGRAALRAIRGES